MKQFACIFIAFILLIASCLTKKPAVRIRADKRDIQLGDSVVFNWEINERKVTQISITDVKDSLPRKGSITLSPKKTGTIEFIIERKKERPLRRRYKIDVAEPEISTFTCPENTTDEKPIEIEWRVENADTIHLFGVRKNLNSYGRLRIRLDSTKELRLVAINRFGEYDVKTKTVNVKIIEDFDAPEEVYFGEGAEINWKFKHCDSITIEELVGSFEPEATLKLLPRETTTYHFTIHGTNGYKRKKEHTIYVLPPEIIYFSAPKTLKKGHEAELTWLVKGKCKIMLRGLNENAPNRGKHKVKPEKTEKYKLVIEHQGKRKAREVKINVIEQRAFVKDAKAFKQLSRSDRFDMEIFAADYSNYPDKVKLYVLAVDDKGNFITGLAPPLVNFSTAKKYFRKLDETVNGKTYNISSYSVTEVHDKIPQPYDISLALDYTVSMENAIQSMENSATDFINKKHNDDRMALLKFSDTLVTLSELSDNAAEIIASANFNGIMNLDGNTALYAATDAAMYALKEATGKRIVYVFTDGIENASFAYYPDRAVNTGQIIETARNTNTRLHFIAYGDEVNLPVLKKTAHYTGGNVYNVTIKEDIQKVFNEMPYILRNYYEIVYKPVKIEGSHKIKLTYNNLQNRNSRTNTEFFIGEEYDISDLEMIKNAYWVAYLQNHDTLSHRKPVCPPQAAAFFHFDKSDLQEKYKPVILKYAGFLSKNPGAIAVIFGHTDSKGSARYCLKLAKERAGMVKKFLVENGIEENRILIEPFGKAHPLWRAEEHEWQARENRRIEILLLE